MFIRSHPVSAIQYRSGQAVLAKRLSHLPLTAVAMGGFVSPLVVAAILPSPYGARESSVSVSELPVEAAISVAPAVPQAVTVPREITPPGRRPGGATDAPCYPNCDNSTNPPCLTANDFQCFLSAAAACLPYANCDGVGPVCPTPGDYMCFLIAYSAGCGTFGADNCNPH